MISPVTHDAPACCQEGTPSNAITPSLVKRYSTFCRWQSTSAGAHACRCFTRSGNAGKFSEVHLTLQHTVVDISRPLTCSSLWTAQITWRRCELCLPYLPDKAGSLQNTALAGFSVQCWGAKTSMLGMQAHQTSER